MFHMVEQSVKIDFVFTSLLWFSLLTAITSLNGINQLIINQ
jgi:hypothetical protein